MDTKLINYFSNHKIKYETYNHHPVFTVEESKKIKTNIPGKHTKCLFLKDENSNFYLIALPAEKRLDTKSLKKKLEIKSLSFASPEELKQKLNLTPGSVSIFGLIYSKNIHLIIDKVLWLSDKVGFHPNINTATLVLSHPNLEKFCNSLNCKKQILEL